MRRMLSAGLVALVLVVGASACQPTPTATITAKASPAKPVCTSTGAITGSVAPAGKVSSVVLQRTVGGKWSDWIWLSGSGSSETSHRLTAKPDATGRYSITYQVPNSSATIHLRVRSAGNTVFSNGVYVSPVTDSPDLPCGY